MSIGESQRTGPDVPQTWDEARPLLRSILRPATYASLLKPGDAIPWRLPATNFLHELVAIDLPDVRLIVTVDNTTMWGVTDTDIFAAGRENVATMHPLSANQPGAGGVFFDAGQSAYIASAILTPGWLASFAQPDGPRPLAFIPNEDTLIIGYDDPHEASGLYDMAEKMYLESERNVSPEGFTVCAGLVMPFDKTGPHPLRRRAIQARTCAAVRQYSEQAEFLKQLYEDELIEAFVASTEVLDTGHGMGSAAIWGEGVIYDLPEVDYLFFINNDGHFAVPFSVVVDLTGIQPTAGFFPPRYRVTGWPEPDVMAALRIHAVTLPTS